MIGAYYKAQALDPIKGLGAVSAQASEAHEAMRSLVMGPIGRFAPWGEQTVEGWKEISPSFNYSLFPINAQTLAQAEQMAVGNPVGLIGVLFRMPVPLQDVDAVVQQGPYQVVKGEAVYRLEDTQPTPTPEFLYFAQLMDDGEREGNETYTKLEQAVAASGGTLVFVVPEARSGLERPAPAVPLETAVGAKLGVPETQAVIAPQSAPAPEPTATHSGLTDLQIYVLGGVGLLTGAFVGFQLLRKRRA